MAVMISFFAPSEIWAEEEEQWEELKSWKEVKDNKIPVLILRDANVDEEQVDIAEDVINSKTKNSERTLFLGWNAGIKEISKSYGVKVPTLQIQYELERSEAITIYLTEKSNMQGFNGFTDLSYDEKGKIKKAFVTIYNVDELNKRQLESIIRHEIGHALGLSHTNTKNDLMQPIINLRYNAISILDLYALVSAY